MNILDYVFAKKMGIAFKGGAYSLAEKAIAQKLGGGSGGGSGGGTYTVTWKNYDGTVLEIDTEVPYGTVPTYNGADPTHTNPDYVWNGWSPAVEAITGDTTYTAQFKDNNVKYIKLIDRSITEISSNVTSIGGYAFYSCKALTSVILHSETVCTLGNTNAFIGTPIKSGTGYIYVPRALVDSYKAATNWSNFASQFRAIEDYPDICGGESA